MHQILVYGDSLSWGIIPNTRHRFNFTERWPGVMEGILLKEDLPVRVIEDCLNGRRTVWDDPFKPGRNGLVGLEQRIEVNSPLALVILMLGTNDFQLTHQNTAWLSAQGIRTLIGAIRRAPQEPEMPVPEVLVVAPPPIQPAWGPIAPKFAGAEKRAVGLAEAIREVALDEQCYFFDAGSVIETSKVDGIHLDENQHKTLGKSLATEVKRIFEQSREA